MDRIARQPIELAGVKGQRFAASEVLRPPRDVRQNVRVAVAVTADPAAEHHRRRQRGADAVRGFDGAFQLLDQAGDDRPERGGQVDQAALRLVLHRGASAVQLGRAPQKGDPAQQGTPCGGLAGAGTCRGRQAIEIAGDLGQVMANRAAARLRWVRRERQVQPQRAQQRHGLLRRPALLLQPPDQRRDRLGPGRLQVGVLAAGVDAHPVPFFGRVGQVQVDRKRADQPLGVVQRERRDESLQALWHGAAGLRPSCILGQAADVFFAGEEVLARERSDGVSQPVPQLVDLRAQHREKIARSPTGASPAFPWHGTNGRGSPGPDCKFRVSAAGGMGAQAEPRRSGANWSGCSISASSAGVSNSVGLDRLKYRLPSAA